MVYADAAATWYNIGLRDIERNLTPAFAFAGNGIEVRDPTSGDIIGKEAVSHAGVAGETPDPIFGEIHFQMALISQIHPPVFQKEVKFAGAIALNL